MRKVILILAGVLFMAVAGNSFALEIGYVDIEKVFNKYKGTTKAKAELEKEVEKEQAELKKASEKLKELLSDLEKKRAVLDPKKIAKKEQDLQMKAEKLQRKRMKIQQDLLAKEKEMTVDILDKIKVIVKKIAKKKKFDYVFEKNMLLFGGDDITPFVIEEINK